MELLDAVRLACQCAGIGPGYNNRFRVVIEACGFRMVEWPVKHDRPQDSMDAPLPMANDPGAWSVPTVIVR